MLGVLGLGVLAAVFAVAVWDKNAWCRAMIEGEVAATGASDVKVEADWFDFDRDTFTYDVYYTTAAGERIANRAKVAITAVADQRVYWLSPLR